MFDGFLSTEFAVEEPSKHEFLPQVLETAFECLFEHCGLWEIPSLRDFSNPVGYFGGHVM